MPLRHRAHKMCEYQADASAELDEETLLYRLKELVQPKHVRTAERVVMGTHDFPPLEVNEHPKLRPTTLNLSVADDLPAYPVCQVDGGRLGT